MLHCTTRPLRFLPLIALAAGILAAAFAPRISMADTLGDKKTGDIRLGVYYLDNGPDRSVFSSAIGTAGLDYYIDQQFGTSRSVFGVDFIQRSSGGNTLQVIPVTLSEQYYHTIGGTSFTPYGEAGLGVYFVSIQDKTNNSLLSTQSESSPGAFIGGGIDLGDSLFLDLRYHLVQNLHGDNPSGYQLTAGLRF